MDPVERVERERELRDSPSTPSTLITDAEDIDDVDDNSMPIAPQPLEKSPAPSRTKSANFAVMGDSAEVSVAWGGGGGIGVRVCMQQALHYSFIPDFGDLDLISRSKV